MGNSLQEYVIRLGAQIDNGGVSQLLGLLDSSKIKALGVSAALAAATTAVYKFVESATKKEFELRKLAKAQNKNTEALRAQNTALKIMGVTLKDIEKDASLKKIYKDLVSFNKELEMPNMDRALNNVRNLQAAFWKLKSIVNYAVQAIGDKILINLETPIKNISENLGKISDWFKKNFEIITSRAATVMSSFSRGVIGIFEGFKKIGELVDKLPAGVKSVGAAVLAVAALVKSGPIGQLLALVTTIGDFIRDYENFQWNKENGKKPGEEGYVRTLNDTLGIWDAYEKDGLSGIGKILGERMNEALEGIDAEELGKGLAGGISKAFGHLSAALSGDGDAGMLGEFVKAGNILAQKIFEFVGSAVTNLSDSDVKQSISTITTSIFEKLSTGMSTALSFVIGKEGENGEYENGLVQYGAELFKNILSFLGEGAKMVEDSEVGTKIGEIVSNLFSRIGTFLSKGSQNLQSLPADIVTTVGSIATSALGIIVQGLDALLKRDPETKKTGIETFVGGVFEFIRKSMKNLTQKIKSGELDFKDTFGDLGTKIGELIGDAITIGADFLTTFASNLAETIEDPEFYDQLVEIGRMILGAILSGLGNIWDAIMRKLFGQRFVTSGERRETVDNIAGLFVDKETGEVKETITGKSGKEYTYGQALEEGSKNTRASQVEFGLRNIEDFEAYRQAFYRTLGQEELAQGLGYSDNFVQNIASMFGMKYDPATLQFYGGKGGNMALGGEENARMFNLVADLSVAGDVESFNSIIDEIKQVAEESGIDTTINITNAQEEGKKAYDEVDAAFQTAIKVDVVANPVVEQAFGGRIGSRMNNVTVGEDGPEYIIPITKTERAVSLINQMLGEMGSGVVNRIFNGLGLGISGTNGASMSALETAITGMQGNSTVNISAPININVNASGSDAKDIGSQVYDLAERNLIKNLTGVYG